MGDLTILTDSLVAMTTLFSLRRADFPLSLHRNACRLLIAHVVTLLNDRQAAGVVTRLIKVKSHWGEPLNEAADALASTAAEADDSPPNSNWTLRQCTSMSIVFQWYGVQPYGTI